MILLLDTHTLIRVFAADPRLAPAARAAVADAANEVYVSAATAWEIAIERAARKLRAPHDLSQGLARYRFRPLDMTIDHALEVGISHRTTPTPSTGCWSPKVGWSD